MIGQWRRAASLYGHRPSLAITICACAAPLFRRQWRQSNSDQSRRGIPMHDVTSDHWHEPEGLKNAGYGAWKRPKTPYDVFMEAQGIPVFRGIGVQQGAEPAAQRHGSGWAAAAPISSSTAPKANGAATWSRCRARARSIAEKHLYEEIYDGGGRPRHHRGVARRPDSSRHVSSGSRARCSRSRSMPGTASSMRRRARRCSWRHSPRPT